MIRRSPPLAPGRRKIILPYDDLFFVSFFVTASALPFFSTQIRFVDKVLEFGDHFSFLPPSVHSPAKESKAGKLPPTFFPPPYGRARRPFFFFPLFPQNTQSNDMSAGRRRTPSRSSQRERFLFSSRRGNPEFPLLLGLRHKAKKHTYSPFLLYRES